MVSTINLRPDLPLESSLDFRLFECETRFVLNFEIYLQELETCFDKTVDLPSSFKNLRIQ